MNHEMIPDLQARAAAERCARCGREVYAPGGLCLYCLAYGNDPV